MNLSHTINENTLLWICEHVCVWMALALTSIIFLAHSRPTSAYWWLSQLFSVLYIFWNTHMKKIKTWESNSNLSFSKSKHFSHRENKGLIFILAPIWVSHCVLLMGLLFSMFWNGFVVEEETLAAKKISLWDQNQFLLQN